MPAATTSAYIFAAYPLSHGFQEKLNRVVGPGARSVLLAELRNSGFRPMLAFLRSLGRRAAVYIPLEDEHSESLLPVLLAVATVSSARSVYIVRSDFSLKKVSRLRALRALVGVAAGMLPGSVALLRAAINTGWLRHRPRRRPLNLESRTILHLNANLWFGVRAGGSVGHVAGVVNAFADAGYRVELASSNQQVMLRDTVRQIVLKAPRAFGFPHELNLLRHNFSVLRQLRRARTAGGYRFIYQRMSVFNYVGVILSRSWRVPLVLEYNGSEVWIAKNWGRPLRFSSIGLAIERVCLRHAHRVVVVSRVLADELLERGVERERIVCYPNCVDPAHYGPDVAPPESAAAVRRRHQIPADAILVAFVGTFGQWHGAGVLAAAIRELIEREDSWLAANNVRFAMIGDGLKMKEVRDLVGGPEYSRWMTFTGLVPQPETIAYLAASEILVSPHVANADGSRFFGSPTKLFEYMAMQKGIIASDLDQIGEVLSAGIRIWRQPALTADGAVNGMALPGSAVNDATAILVRPGHVPDLVAAIKLLVDCPDLRRRLAANARRELLRHYTWSHHVGHILNSLSGDSQTEPHAVEFLQSV